MTPNEQDMARDLAADLEFLEAKRRIPRLEYDVEDDVDIAFRAKIERGWDAAIRRTLAAEAGYAAQQEAIRVLTKRAHDAEGQLRKVVEFMDGVRALARNRNPEGCTLLDFMAVWNEQYQRRIAELEAQLAREKK